MSIFLHFPFSREDQEQIHSIESTEVPDDFNDNITRNLTGLRHAQALQLRFRFSGPNDEPPQLLPLFPGEMCFIRTEAIAAPRPDPVNGNISRGQYSSWVTTGAIAIRATRELGSELDSLSPAPVVMPNLIWYSEVWIPPEFLFDTLINDLKRGQVGSVSLDDEEEWMRHAIAGFLNGTYCPELQTRDDVDAIGIRPMPRIKIDTDGSSSLRIITARTKRTPWDSSTVKSTADSEFDTGTFTRTHRLFPGHPLNARIPARHALQSLRTHMFEVDDSPSAQVSPIADAVVGGDPGEYVPFLFTRSVFQIASFCALYLNKQVVIENNEGNLIRTIPLPAHGTVLLKGIPNEGKVRLTGDILWLDGRREDTWATEASNQPVSYQATSGAHIVVRQDFSLEVLADPKIPAGGSAKCTFFSLRRFLRAYFDHRLTGGRLAWGREWTTTKYLISLNDALSNIAPELKGESPKPDLSKEELGEKLREIAKATFGDHEGLVAYLIWQSAWKAFTGETEQPIPGVQLADFEGFRATGAPGAAVKLELADWHIRPDVLALGSNQSVFDQASSALVQRMKVGLRPGAALQFWEEYPHFIKVASRMYEEPSVGDRIRQRDGHSMIFHSYEYDSADPTRVTGINVIDYNVGTEREPQKYLAKFVPHHGGERIKWHSYHPAVWVSANWKP